MQAPTLRYCLVVADARPGGHSAWVSACWVRMLQLRLEQVSRVKVGVSTRSPTCITAWQLQALGRCTRSTEILGPAQALLPTQQVCRVHRLVFCVMLVASCRAPPLRNIWWVYQLRSAPCQPTSHLAADGTRPATISPAYTTAARALPPYRSRHVAQHACWPLAWTLDADSGSLQG